MNPGIHISTSWAFGKIKPNMPATHLNQIDFEKSEDLSDFKEIIVNDFEPTVFHFYPEIKEIKERMYDLGADLSLMTGSGSTVYGIFPDIISAQSALKEFPSNYFTFINR